MGTGKSKPRPETLEKRISRYRVESQGQIDALKMQIDALMRGGPLAPEIVVPYDDRWLTAYELSDPKNKIAFDALANRDIRTILETLLCSTPLLRVLVLVFALEERIRVVGLQYPPGETSDGEKVTLIRWEIVLHLCQTCLSDGRIKQGHAVEAVRLLLDARVLGVRNSRIVVNGKLDLSKLTGVKS